MKTLKFKRLLTAGIVFTTSFLFFFIIFSENLLKYVVLTNLPALSNPKLLSLHLVANVLLFASKLAIGILMLYIYYRLRSQRLPFMGFIWIYAVWLILMSLVFGMNILALYRVYIWIDGLIRIAAGLFGFAVAISLVRGLKYMLNYKGPEEYGKLADEIKALRKENQDLQKIINKEVL